MNPELDLHASIVGGAIDAGKVIPFLGAGANLCDRPELAEWHPGTSLPSGSELSRYLAAKYHYPGEDPRDLVRVASANESTAARSAATEGAQPFHFTEHPRGRVSGVRGSRPSRTASSASRRYCAFRDGSPWSASGAPR